MNDLRGNPGKRKRNTREPQPAGGAPAMPAKLPAEARAEWKRVVPELDRLKLLSIVDRAALTAYCLAWNELWSATLLLEEEGRIVESPVRDRHGKKIGTVQKAHPAVKLQRDAFARVRAFLQEFGLSPASRARLQVPQDESQDDPLTALIRRQAESRSN